MKTNYLGKSGQERMKKNGWTIKLANSYNETPEEIYERLSADYTQVKVYYEATQIRGLHSYFAMVKR